MKDIATLAIPAHTLCRLLQYADAHQSKPGAGELAATAIEEWLARADGTGAPRTRLHGYQWKTVFLPDGTQLRAWNRSGYAYAEVIGDVIVHEGDAVSPHEFICRCKGISRSAWAEVALLFPGEDHWKRADAHRRDLARPLASQDLRPAALASVPSLPPSPRFSSVLPATDVAEKPTPNHTRLPRVLPIPTQANHKLDVHDFETTDRTLIDTAERRRAYRRQADLLLD
jgi:hypothetical protein